MVIYPGVKFSNEIAAYWDRSGITNAGIELIFTFVILPDSTGNS
ncbi:MULTISPECIES: hypothetical protein [unclassified Coleofasciculus]|nr:MULTISPECIES: hypothetical protein [unclassified Coleofasciculus]